MVRIHSEHAIGFLKGCFQSLKSLRVQIDSEDAHKYATYWILACIVVHNFALDCEAQERDSDESADEDPFIREGLTSSESSSSENQGTFPGHGTQHTLSAARNRQEQLKDALFRAKEQRARRNIL